MKKSRIFGRLDVGLSNHDKNLQIFNEAMKEALKLNFKTLKESDKKLYNFAWKVKLKGQFKRDGIKKSIYELLKLIERTIRHAVKKKKKCQ